MSADYGWDNPAPGTRLWRLRTCPETLTLEDAVKVAQDIDATLATGYSDYFRDQHLDYVDGPESVSA